MGRLAEFGFLGVKILALITTPRNCGFVFKTEAQLCFFFFKAKLLYLCKIVVITIKTNINTYYVKNGDSTKIKSDKNKGPKIKKKQKNNIVNVVFWLKTTLFFFKKKTKIDFFFSDIKKRKF